MRRTDNDAPAGGVRRRWLLGVLAACLLLAGPTGQRVRADEEEGAQPKRYGDTPEELLPFRGTGEPYARLFTEPPVFRGPGAEAVEPAGLKEVRLGVIAPLGGIDKALGVRMVNGIRLAIEEANAGGGFRNTLPFNALVRDENMPWGAAANTVVDLAYEHGVWGLIGALEDSVSHVRPRVLLKVEVPMINAGGPDPTLTEHAIPWLVRMRPDDRQTGYRLAKRIFHEDGRRRVAVFRANDRYGRTGTMEFVDAARRLHHPILLEVRFGNHDDTYAIQVERLRNLKPDAIVIWGRAGPCGRALKALRAGGLEQPIYGPDRLMDQAFLDAAGAAAEGTVFTYPFDPGSKAAAWTAFRTRYRARFRAAPDAVAAYAYDATRYLVQAVREGGLNRVKIRERLFAHDGFEGVMGTIPFDSTHNNISPVILGHVQGGTFHFD